MKQDKAKIIISEEIADGIVSVWLETETAAEALPGQFIMINTH